MPGKRKRRRRTKGEDGKMYDVHRQKDAGHKAHETPPETMYRRAKWKVFGTDTQPGVLGRLWRMLSGR